MDGDRTTAADGDIAEPRIAGQRRPRRVVAASVTVGVAIVCSGAAAFVLFALVLLVDPIVVVPLAVAGTAVVAALPAAWTSTLISRDGTRADLGAVLRSVVPAALVLLVVVTPLFAIISIGFIAVALTFGVLSVVAARAAWTRRTRVGTASGDVRVTLIVLAVAAAVKATLPARGSRAPGDARRRRDHPTR